MYENIRNSTKAYSKAKGGTQTLKHTQFHKGTHKGIQDVPFDGWHEADAFKELQKKYLEIHSEQMIAPANAQKAGADGVDDEEMCDADAQMWREPGSLGLAFATSYKLKPGNFCDAN